MDGLRFGSNGNRSYRCLGPEDEVKGDSICAPSVTDTSNVPDASSQQNPFGTYRKADVAHSKSVAG